MNTTLKVEGMSCNHCVMAVTEALGKIDGISHVNVDLAKGEVNFDKTESVDMAHVIERIEQVGYTVG